ncbi:antibiotic biosynthesis monooxygenase [Saccharothrix sp. S26]|uniref:antibiotic biosynthesis monooxygenase family protein n=1 Tax=Saccharothrix sp. S26 TaxID=2907215 RepID=UPI001F4805EA|nr:antibiotic biosynthesis monooxygenase [Saccharothrix sp. S26]MCE7000778.1 antibiotic biosynthesis monooxygenase [Saccharothrix sp. S26]
MLISINKATLTDCPPEEYEAMYAEAGDFMAKQDGHVGQLFVRSQTDPNVYVTVLVWSDLERYNRLDDMPQLMEIFERVVALSGPGPDSGDRIVLEHHKADVVYAGRTSPDEAKAGMVCLNRIRLVDCSDEFYEEVYRQGSDLMAAQPGHLRHKLVRSREDASVYFSVAEWESLDHYRALDRLDALTDIFARVNDKIDIENHECVVVYENSDQGADA